MRKPEIAMAHNETIDDERCLYWRKKLKAHSLGLDTDLPDLWALCMPRHF